MEEDSVSVSRPWARIFDLILSEYAGYDDEKILNLTLDRILQMVDVIHERQQEEFDLNRKDRLMLAELAVKHIATAFAVAGQSKKGNKWLQDFVRKMDFLKAFDLGAPENEEDNLPSTAGVMSAFGAGPDGQVGKRVS